MAGPKRVVLGFYSGDEESAERACRAVRKTDPKAQYFPSHDGNPGDVKPGKESYATLRLPDESLIVSAVERDKLTSVVNTLRATGEPALFILRAEPIAEFRAQAGDTGVHDWRTILEQLAQCETITREARSDLLEASRLDHTITESAKWLLDNGHLLRASAGEIRRALPRGLRHRLSRFTTHEGALGVGELARHIVATTDHAIDEATIIAAIEEYQKRVPLSIAELWIFPIMLRFAVVEALATLASQVNRQQQIRETGYLWSNRLAAAARRDEVSLNRILSLLQAHPLARETYFATCLAEQLQDEERALIPVRQWIETERDASLAEIIRHEHQREAAESLSIANAVSSLRALSRIDFAEVFESLNVAEIELRRDPAGIYPSSDFRTRDRCRRAVETISGHSRYNEQDVARRAIELAETANEPEQRQVAWYLLAGGREALEKACAARVPLRGWLKRKIRRHATFVYLSGIFSITLCFLVVAMSLAWEMGVRSTAVLIGLGTLALFPLSELAIQIINALIIATFHPEPLAKMDFGNGIPAGDTTLVVVPMMLTSLEVVRQELAKLEVRYLANQDANLYFSLFSDFTDAAEATVPDDAELLKAIHDGIDELNRRHPGNKFLLFHRRRVWSETQQRWIGRERKRGKIEDLNRFLRGKGSEEIKIAGELPAPVRYVITLDADTELPPGTARKLVATIAHPLNLPVLDPVTKVRRRGYTIIQPRVSIGLPGATASRFTRMFADTTGTDPYTQQVSDAQQELFGEAIFHGKAIYNVVAFDESLGERFPVETLLSHDLIEGAHVGVGLATDIELFENMPLDYAGFCRRQHRWIRGDWQIAAWIFRHVPSAHSRRARNPLPIVSRWRVLDNLRRSLVPIASMLLLVLGWMISSAPGAWSLIVGVALAIPAVAPWLDRIARHVQGLVIGWRGAHDDLLRALVLITFLPHQALLSADAIGRVVYRKYVSRRHLLEWQTAERAAADSHLHLSATMRQMIGISICSLLLTVFLAAHHAFAPGSFFVLLWIASPGLLYWLSRPSGETATHRLLRENYQTLRNYARQTWRFFDDLVGPKTNWLPPDNTQLALHLEVANRTSPTNIGLWLCSALAARDFGYLTADDLLARCANTIDTLERLQRYEGHLLNWYNTDNLEPLLPRYVSTVDSGNLVASLWLFAQGCRDVVRGPLLSNGCMRGLADTLAQIERLGRGDPALSVPLLTLRKLLRGKGNSQQLIGRLRMAAMPAEQLVAACKISEGDEICYWASCLAREIGSWNRLIDTYLKWVESLTRLPDSLLGTIGADVVRFRRRAVQASWSLDTIASGGPPMLQQILARRTTPSLDVRLEKWLDDLEAERREAQERAAQAVEAWQGLANRARTFADGVNMRFLYDPKRKLFGIGYMVGGPVEFASHYDLLASECRVASLVSIAKGDVPFEHWFLLGRPRLATPEGPTLLSWSGTMFEYLMPLLFTKTFPNSLLDEACRDAVVQQIEWSRERRLPWGVSECAYSALDANRIYQYHAFGVPSLALNAGLDEAEIIAPYATMLALQVDLRSSLANLHRLSGFGIDGPMGFYEAIDFTRPGSRSKRGVIIYTYMSHHQGMSLLALNNTLHRDVMQRRFHADRRVKAIESLLFERVPNTPLPEEDVREAATSHIPAAAEDPPERIWRENTAVPRVHLYSNGRFALMLTNSGGSYSRWNDFDLSRWRSDTTRDCWGTYLYLRDVRGGQTWSAAWHPVGGNLGQSSVRFLADHTEYHRRVQEIESLQAVTVSPEDDAEIRRLTITNWSGRQRELEVTSYVELAMASHGADTAHPAFAKMFVETEHVDDGLLFAHRRPRSENDPPIWTAHLLVGAPGGIQYETNRETFLGRGNTPVSPEALGRDLNGSVGTVIDPIFSLRCRIMLAPRMRLEIGFITLAARSRDELVSLVAKFRRGGAVAQAFEIAWTRSQLEFRYLGIGPARAHRFQELAGYLLYPNVRLRSPDRIARNHLGQSGLWALGISGDLPMIVVTIADERGLNVVRELLLAHQYWRMRGLRVDLVMLNQESPSYDLPLRNQLKRLIDAHSTDTGIDKPGGVFLRDWHPMPEDVRNLILSSASVVLSASRESLQQQLAGIAEPPAVSARFTAESQAEEASQPLPFLELPYFNGRGGFTRDGREYAIYLKPGDDTPAPWANIMSHAGFGAMVTESGLGFTWRGNSQMNRLTPWNNDPVSDEPAEAIYLRDEETGAYWSPTPQPVRGKEAYRARHGQGYTAYEHNGHAIGQELTVFVPLHSDGTGDPVKIYRLHLRNDSPHARKLSCWFFADWVLGGVRENSQLHVQTSCDPQSGAILARQYWNGAYAGHVAFAASGPAPASYSADRSQILGRNRGAANPAALERAQLDNRTGVAMDPGVALKVEVTLERGAQADVVFLLGQTDTVEECRALLARYGSVEQIDGALAETRRFWDSLLGTIEVRTPVLSIDLIVNRWLLYQALSCRFWGRSAFYQSGGAIGFRDQLQDSLALVYAVPHLTRAHILTAAARQFTEGDVQHWWHPETGMGVRTRCSDDLLWLPFAVAHYVKVTGDSSVLRESVPFLEAPPLASDEGERMSIPAISRESESIWEHCRRSLEQGSRLGVHGLPLMGTGDWNDGMNLVGAEGRGESVWLAWFLAVTLKQFASITERHFGHTADTAEWRKRAAEVAAACEESCWDGDWYLRAFFDDGSPLGSHANKEATVDSLPQSWAVISKSGNEARAKRAMESAQRWLVDRRSSLVKLFTPPFDHSTPHPGYIMGYPPGLRENGGQYTHGALWMALAWARLGDGERAAELLTMMNPIERARTAADSIRYCGEPYAVAADVSSAPGREGRSGWTWYTGSASWMYRIWVEEVLGFHLRGDVLTIDPVIPPDWNEFEIRYRYGSTIYEIKVQREVALESPVANVIQLRDDGAVHQITVRLPKSQLLLPSGDARKASVGA